MSDYTGKFILITGAAHGIGTAFAHYFASRNGHLLLLDIETERLAQVTDKLPNKERHRMLAVDIGKLDQCQALFDELQDEGVFVEVLVNNVGIGHYSSFSETSWERLERIIDVNIKGTTFLTWLFLPSMLNRDVGTIINLSSTGAFFGALKSTVYTATKAYVSNFTEGLDVELMGSGVKTLTAHPGATDTHFWEDAGTINAKYYHRVKKMPPEATVDEFMRALDSGSASIIAGWQNRLMVFLAKFVPRPVLKRMAVKKYQ